MAEGQGRRFAQVGLEVYAMGLKAREHDVYGVLCWYASMNPNANAWPSVATIAEHIGCSKATVKRALKGLIAHGLIARIHEGGNGQADTSRYRVRQLSGSHVDPLNGMKRLNLVKEAAQFGQGSGSHVGPQLYDDRYKDVDAGAHAHEGTSTANVRGNGASRGDGKAGSDMLPYRCGYCKHEGYVKRTGAEDCPRCGRCIDDSDLLTRDPPETEPETFTRTGEPVAAGVAS